MVKRKRSKESSSSSSSSTTRKPKHSSTSSSKPKNPENPNPDLISALPDALLLHILSLLLDTPTVIQTSLLSSRWRYLWRSVPCLTLKGTANYIDKCLLFHHDDSKVQKLHIILSYEEDKPAILVDSWLHFAIKCKVEDFKLDLFNRYGFKDEIHYDQLYKLPHSFYLLCTSTTLTSLSLHGCYLNLPDSFQFGSLKNLSLEVVELNPDSIEHLSSSCPLLEDLNVVECDRKSDLNIVITNEHVKRLKISRHGHYGFWNLKINAPTLLSLVIVNCYPTVRFHVENLASLISVDIIAEEDFLITSCDDDEDVYFEPDGDINCFENLLYDLRHVKHLKLCDLCLQVLSLMKLMSSHILSISATCLELKARLKKWEFPGIRYLLENCSNLEKLKFVDDETCCEQITLTKELTETHDFEEEEYWASFETEVPSIMQNIKTIEIELRYERFPEKFVRFLLKNAKILESMVINTPKTKILRSIKYNNVQLSSLRQRLLAFPRSSPNAKLFIT